MGASEIKGSSGSENSSFIFFFYILTIFLKLYQINLILFSSPMTWVLWLQILIPWHLGILLMKP